jgi:hypothetical protein
MYRERWLCLKSEEKLELAARVHAQSPFDMDAALDALLQQSIRRCRHTEPLVAVFRWTTALALLAILGLIVGGLVDVIGFAGLHELAPLESILLRGVASASLVASTTWLIGWRLELKLLAAQRELRDLIHAERVRLATATGARV